MHIEKLVFTCNCLPYLELCENVGQRSKTILSLNVHSIKTTSASDHILTPDAKQRLSVMPISELRCVRASL